MVLAGYTIFSSTTGYITAHDDHMQLSDTIRYLQINQKPTSAHMAGHYGYIVFKPATFLQAIDPGVNPFTGTTVRLEAHRQNEAVFSSASGQSSLVRFGAFSFSLLLQVVFPLLIIFTCYRSIINDRQNGTLKLLISQGATMRKLVLGKTMAYTFSYCTFLLLAAIIYAIVFSGHTHKADAGGVVLRIMVLLGLYGLYYLLLIALTVYLSGRTKTAPGLLVGLLAVWFVFTIIIPKSAVNIGVQRSPLPTRFEMNNGIAEIKKGGIDGHNSRNERTKKFTDSVLKAYGVDSANQLPVKMGGLLMQADEDFNNEVYDKALLGISGIIAEQNKIGSLSAFIDPFMAIKNLSMAIAGTDMYHHFDFTRDAEAYRRDLIRKLNEQDADRTSVFKDEKGKMKKEFWEQIKDYKYTSPSLEWSLQNCMPELLALALWLMTSLLVIYFTANKISIV